MGIIPRQHARQRAHQRFNSTPQLDDLEPFIELDDLEPEDKCLCRTFIALAPRGASRGDPMFVKCVNYRYQNDPDRHCNFNLDPLGVVQIYRAHRKRGSRTC